MKLKQSLTLAGHALARSLEARIRLFVAELEYERLRLVKLVSLTVIGATALGASILSGTAFVVMIVDEAYRAHVLFGATAVLIIAGITCLFVGLRTGQDRSAFQATAEALKEDCECLASLINE